MGIFVFRKCFSCAALPADRPLTVHPLLTLFYSFYSRIFSEVSPLMDKYFATLTGLQKEAWREGSKLRNDMIERWKAGSKLRNAQIARWKPGGALRTEKIERWKPGGAQRIEKIESAQQRAQTMRGGATRRQRGGSALGSRSHDQIAAQTVVTPNGNVFFQTSHHESTYKKQRIPCIGNCGEDFARGEYKRQCAKHLHDPIGHASCFSALKDLDEEELQRAIIAACADESFRPKVKTAKLAIEKAKSDLEENGGKPFGRVPKRNLVQTEAQLAANERRKRQRTAAFFTT